MNQVQDLTSFRLYLPVSKNPSELSELQVVSSILDSVLAVSSVRSCPAAELFRLICPNTSHYYGDRNHTVLSIYLIRFCHYPREEVMLSLNLPNEISRLNHVA